MLVFDATCLSHFGTRGTARRPARLDTIEELQCFAKWCRRIGGEPRNRGESSVFAAVERHGGVAITDDRDAVRVGRAYGLSVHGSLWLLARACGAGKVTEVGAGNLIERLRETGMRLPCTGRDFGAFSRRHGLL